MQNKGFPIITKLNAIACDIVLSLPSLPAAITLPFAAATILIPLTKNSLAIMTIVIIEPKGPSIPSLTSIISALAVNSLSAIGSMSFPKSLTMFCFLAIAPSSMSVINATINTPAAM